MRGSRSERSSLPPAVFQTTICLTGIVSAFDESQLMMAQVQTGGEGFPCEVDLSIEMASIPSIPLISIQPHPPSDCSTYMGDALTIHIDLSSSFTASSHPPRVGCNHRTLDEAAQAGCRQEPISSRTSPRPHPERGASGIAHVANQAMESKHDNGCQERRSEQ